MQALLLADVHFADAVFCVPAAGTISGEEFPIVSKTKIKEYRDSFSCETFSFLANPNITSMFMSATFHGQSKYR